MIDDSASLEDARLFASWLTMNGKLIFIDAKQPQRTLTCYLLQMQPQGYSLYTYRTIPGGTYRLQRVVAPCFCAPLTFMFDHTE